MDFKIPGFKPVALGGEDEINVLILEATKIGMGKVEVNTVTGQRNRKPMPLLLNDPNRVVLVREMPPEEFSIPGQSEEESFVTASQAFMSDGSARIIVERPGIFAMKVNEGGNVPVLG